MILVSERFDQQSLAQQWHCDRVASRYRELFALIDWTALFPDEGTLTLKVGKPAHPKSAYVKALLVKLTEHHEYITQVRHFLLDHPFLVLELGFRPVLDPTQDYGFDVEKTVPSARWLRHQQQRLPRRLLHDLLVQTVHALQAEIAGLGETVAIDVKHIYAWVKANNLRDHVIERFDPARRPRGDPDCRLGVKRVTNQVHADGTTTEQKEHLWGYGSGIVSAITAEYGDVVLAEYTLPFNQTDITYFRPLYRQVVASLGFYPTSLTADAAFDAWYVYQMIVHPGGIAAVALNQHAHPTSTRDPDGVPHCPIGLRMHPSFQFHHTNGYRAHRYRCPLLHPEPTGQSCEHEQFLKKKGCVKDINIEKGGIMRVSLDRTGPLYKTIYRQRTSAERINSQAKSFGIERPKVRNRRSVENLNTLTYVTVNLKALLNAQKINASLLNI